VRLLRVVSAALGVSLLHCAATEKAQQRDPMRCEQDPKCAAARGAYVDCYRQCSDDPECVQRCLDATVDQPKH
jgi:hypothetical protein